jgi:outer membrane receptor protein involved in Fe transport
MERKYGKQSIIVFLWVCMSSMLYAQKTVSGKVTDGTGAGLAGVSVIERGTKNGIVSDASGNYTLAVGEKATLVFSFIGMNTVELAIGNSSTVDVKMEEGENMTDDLVVTATRQPIRKLDATTAIDIVSAKQLQNNRPEGIAEAVRNVPGLFVTNAQGRYRGTIYTRGFPDGSGNGMIYTTMQLDGLPTLATPARPADFNFGVDDGVERIEVVRGGAATLFGRSAAAGVVNVITKTGGTKHSMSAKMTTYNKNVSRSESGVDYRVDLAASGPLSKNLRYNVAGFYLKDRGYRDLGYPDVGGQVRFNIDYLFGKGSKLRVYSGYTDMAIQNMIDIPYDLSTFKPKSDWKPTDSYYNANLDTISYRVAHNKERGNPAAGLDTITRTVQAANKDGNYARGSMSGLRLDWQIGGGWSLSEHFRYNRFNEGTKFNLGSSNFFKATPALGAGVGAVGGAQFRLIIDGDAKERSTMNEIRLSKQLDIGNSTHRLSIGHYYSREDYSPETYSLSWWASANKDSLKFGSPSRFFQTAALNPFATRFGGRSRIEHYFEDVNAVFFGDEAQFGNKLSVNFGARYDALSLKMQGFNRADTIITRDTTHADWSASLGLNYKLGGRSAVYANFTRAFRMPDYSAYTVLTWNAATKRYTNAPDGIKKNEIIQNVDVGYRTGVGDVGIDAALFYTHIENRLAVFYENGVGISKPQGTNTIKGIEFGLTYTPSNIRGLLIRGNFSYQKGVYDEFNIAVGSAKVNNKWVYNVDPKGNLYGNTIDTQADSTTTKAAVYSINLKGKQLPSIPSTVFNLVGSYDSKYFGINASYNLSAGIYADATNIIKTPNYHTVNAGLYGRYELKNKSELRIDFLVKNLINSDDVFRLLYLGESDAVLTRKQIDPTLASATSGYVTGIPQLPRRFLVTLGYKF